MRNIHGERLRDLRVERGLTQRELASRVGMHEVHIAKLELGTVKSTSRARAERLARALGVSVDEISSAPPSPPIALWAARHGYTIKYAQQLARLGRIEGARKEMVEGYPEAIWVMEEDARKLPPNEAQRAQWREHWHRYHKTERQRERRSREKREKEEDG